MLTLVFLLLLPGVRREIPGTDLAVEPLKLYLVPGTRIEFVGNRFARQALEMRFFFLFLLKLFPDHKVLISVTLSDFFHFRGKCFWVPSLHTLPAVLGLHDGLDEWMGG